MSVSKKDTFKQDTPRMQLVALVQAAEGHLSNIESGIGMSPQVSARKATGFLEEAQEILRQMPEGEWEIPNTDNRDRLCVTRAEWKEACLQARKERDIAEAELAALKEGKPDFNSLPWELLIIRNYNNGPVSSTTWVSCEKVILEDNTVGVQYTYDESGAEYSPKMTVAEAHEWIAKIRAEGKCLS